MCFAVPWVTAQTPLTGSTKRIRGQQSALLVPGMMLADDRVRRDDDPRNRSAGRVSLAPARQFPAKLPWGRRVKAGWKGTHTPSRNRSVSNCGLAAWRSRANFLAIVSRIARERDTESRGGGGHAAHGGCKSHSADLGGSNFLRHFVDFSRDRGAGLDLWSVRQPRYCRQPTRCDCECRAGRGY